MSQSETSNPLPTSDEVYENVWKPIVEEDGEVNFDTVKTLLSDYAAMLHSNTILYPYITDGRVTHPQHDLEEVINISDECVAGTMDEGIQKVLDHLLDTLKAVDTESPEVQLESLVQQLNTLYERPSL